MNFKPMSGIICITAIAGTNVTNTKKIISKAGFSHSGCVTADNSVFIWGRNDVNCAMNRNVLQSGKLTNIN